MSLDVTTQPAAQPRTGFFSSQPILTISIVLATAMFLVVEYIWIGRLWLTPGAVHGSHLWRMYFPIQLALPWLLCLLGLRRAARDEGATGRVSWEVAELFAIAVFFTYTLMLRWAVFG